MNLQEVMYESHYNAALLAFKHGAFQDSYEYADKVMRQPFTCLFTG
jgi:hypothetical protein